MRESVGDGALKQLLDRGMKRLAGSEIGIEGPKSGKETLLLAAQSRGLEICQRSLPAVMLSAQSNKSPIWASI